MFVTFEGIEGCGKSTQARRLEKNLGELGIPAVLTLEPGGTRIGGDIRRILLDFKNRDLCPLAELLLYAADRAQHVEEVIKPALQAGKWVVCDRFFDATTVYQGMARQQDMTLVKMLNEKASMGIRPDITFLLDCPPEVGLKRALSRNQATDEKGQDRFEREERAFHEAVRQGYLLVAKDEPHRFRVVDATLQEDAIEALILEHLRPLIPKG